MGIAFLSHYTPAMSTDDISAITKGYKFVMINSTSKSVSATGTGSRQTIITNTVFSWTSNIPIRSVIIAGTLVNNDATYDGGNSTLRRMSLKTSDYSNLAASETNFNSQTKIDIVKNSEKCIGGRVPASWFYGGAVILKVDTKRLDLVYRVYSTGGNNDDYQDYDITTTVTFAQFPTFIAKVEFDV